MLCRPLCCGIGLASTWAHTDARTHGQTHTRAHSGRCFLSQKDSSLELILGHKSSGSVRSEFWAEVAFAFYSIASSLCWK